MAFPAGGDLTGLSVGFELVRRAEHDEYGGGFPLLDHRTAMPAGFPFAESRDVGQVGERRDPPSEDLSPARTDTFDSARNLGFGEN
jgi:hypothetical protein